MVTWKICWPTCKNILLKVLALHEPAVLTLRVTLLICASVSPSTLISSEYEHLTFTSSSKKA